MYEFVEPHEILVIEERIDIIDIKNYMLENMNLTQNLEYTAVIKTYRPGDR